ncbi:MAG: TolC family outer membrane protein [Magnetococcales bacterium]|nr:TolC family outer membrane protein [Magnetococcales bacterium]
MNKTRFSIREVAITASMMLLTSSAAHGEDLWQIYTLAVQHDAGLAVAGEKKTMGMEAVPQGLASLLPNASLTLQQSAVSLQKPIHDQYGQGGYALNFQLPVFHWEKIQGYQQAKKEEKRALVAYAAAEQALVMRTAQLYYDALSSIDTLQFALAEKEAMTQRLKSTKARLEVGTAVMTDMHDAQAAFDLAETGVIRAKDQRQGRFEALEEVVGQPVSQLAPLKSEIPLVKPDPAEVDRWVEKAQTENLTLRLAQLEREIAESGAQAAWAGHLPAVDVMAAHTYSDSGALPQFDGGTLRSNSVTVQMTLPLYAGQGVSSKVRQAKAGESMAQQAEEMTRRQVIRQTRDGYRGVLSAIAQIQATRQVLRSSQSNLETTEAGYEAGIRTMTDVLASQRELFRAKRDHAQARYGYILQTIGLKHVAGLLSDQDLKAVNAWNQN